jgi:signal transduction histidine kinase/ActR/RegA family two-component response regulator
MGTPDPSLFRTGVWVQALQRYSATTHLTVVLFGRDGERLSEPSSVTPVFERLNGSGHGTGLFAACAARALTRPAGAPPVVEEEHGLAVVGTPLILADETIGAAVAGYLVTRFADQLVVQRLALRSNVPVGELWTLLRQQLPLARERIMVYGELLQTLCGALLSEIYRAQQLGEKSAQLAEESQAKDRFLAVLSHELRTPLNAMLGWAQLLRDGRLGAEASKRALEVIERNTRLQAQLIEDLLHVSRIISGKVELDRHPLGLAPVIDAAVDAQRPSLEAKGIRLDMALDPAAGLVSADPDRFGQVVANLLSNAIKFTPAGGRIEVRLEPTDHGVQLTVADSGIGIRPDVLPFIFDRFRQADSSQTREYTGLGLGLAVVRHLVLLHGGSVEAVSSGEGQGATFTVCLPALPAVDARDEGLYSPLVEARARRPIPSLDGVRVLIVDDEADARELFRRVLEQHMIEVADASSAHEALVALKRWKPDVLISDLGMPRESGYDLIRKVRRLTPDEGGSTPAVAVTAYAQAEEGQLALAAGFQLHVPKPVEPTALALAVAQLAGRLKAT